MKIEVNIPTSLADITLRTYQRIIAILKTEPNDVETQRAILSIGYNMDSKQINNMKVKDRNILTNAYVKALSEKPTLVLTFKHRDVEYGFTPNIDEITFAEYVDLDKIKPEYETIHNIMAILYRIVIRDHVNDKTYDIAGYDNDMNDVKSNWFKDTPANIGVGMLLFFWSLNHELSNYILNCSMNQTTSFFKHKLTSVRSGRGTRISTPSPNQTS